MTSAELDAVRADDLLLDALGTGLDWLDAAGDPASAALARWRQELGAATDAVGVAELDLPAPAVGAVTLPPRPAPGVRRGLAALAATAAVLAGGGVAAAAVTGPHGPLGGLHRLIFGGMHQLPAHAGSGDTVVVQTERLLDHAAQLLRSAPRPVPAPDRAAIAGMLNRAAALLSSDFRLDASRDAQLAARLDRLRTLLATLSASPPRATSGPAGPPSAGAVRPAPHAVPTESAPAVANGASRGEGRPAAGSATPGDGSQGEHRSTAPRRTASKPAESIAPVESSAASSAGDNGSGASEDNGSGTTTSGGNADGNQPDAAQPGAHPSSGSGGQGGAGDQGGSGGGSNGDGGGGGTGGTGDQ